MHGCYSHHHRWHAASRHGYRGFGPGEGPFGGRFRSSMGGPFRGGKLIADGDLRLIVLALLAEQPRHGYDVIKALEERSRGAYSPSPGVVYPTLTYLEEAGYASASAEGNKKVYAITEGGKEHLEENRDIADMILSGMAEFGEKMARARAWYYRHEDAANSRHPRSPARGQRGAPHVEGGDRREARCLGGRAAQDGQGAPRRRCRHPRQGRLISPPRLAGATPARI